ncbi:MAG: hypothetical protein MMC33_001953 [Icmadophila ericetorum]|nr:hypothetical protein [Icmadophila ericetorum]
MAKNALLWLTFSLRRLTLGELCEAVIVDDDQANIDDDVRLLNPKTLLRTLSNLINHNAVTRKVTLAHSSVQTYLTSKELRNSDVYEFYLDILTAVNAITIRCLKYLSLPAFRLGYCSSEIPLQQRFDAWPLLGYVADTFFLQLTYIKLGEPLRSLLLLLFATHSMPGGGSFGVWVQAYYYRRHKIFATKLSKNSTPLYFAAREGLLPLVKLILDTEGTKNMEVPGGFFESTPLHVVAWAGRIEVVKELLRVGANVKERNSEGKSGLYWAVRQGDTEMEQILRDAGAEMGKFLHGNGYIPLYCRSSIVRDKESSSDMPLHPVPRHKRTLTRPVSAAIDPQVPSNNAFADED